MPHLASEQLLRCTFPSSLCGSGREAMVVQPVRTGKKFRMQVFKLQDLKKNVSTITKIKANKKKNPYFRTEITNKYFWIQRARSLHLTTCKIAFLFKLASYKIINNLGSCKLWV